MGGTSTDVALYAGELERTTDAVIAAVRVSAPMLKIQTVAAGGGSILSFGQGRLQGRARVGRRAAGAEMLPARRAADGHRCEPAARPNPPRLLPARVRPERRRAARRRRDERARSRRWRATSAAATGDAPAPRASRRGLRAHRRRAHGQRDQANLRAARPRRDAVRAVLLRRRRRPARRASSRSARHPARSSFIRWPACCPPTASASPTSACCARSASRRRSTRRCAATLAARFETLAAERARGAARARRRRERTRGSSGACSSKSPEPIRRLPVAWHAARGRRASSRLRFASCTRGTSAFAWPRTRRSSSSRWSSKPSLPGLDDAPPAAPALPPAQRSSARSRSRAATSGASISWRNVPVYAPSAACRPARG